MKRIWLGLRIFFVLTVLAAVLGIAAQRYESKTLYGAGPSAAPVTLVIARGTGTPEIAHQLEANGLIAHWWFFELAVQFIDTGGPLHAGEYAFAPAQSLHDILRQLREGRTVVHRLTVPEGLTVSEIRALVAAEPALSGDAGPPPAEGSLMPDTYNFSLSDPRAGMVARMRRAMDKALADAWADRAPGLPLPSSAAALTLASIVEKESAIPDERPKVAAVFLNRLKAGMRLQADPTVIYALTLGKGALGRPLIHADLNIDSPYNSYRYEGLPPTPIACPGRTALHAALHPDPTSALYFVADGSGGHVFADRLDDHNRNVAKLRQLEHMPAVPN
jgi:UPF0755 protein